MKRDIVFLQMVDRKCARKLGSIPYVEVLGKNGVGEVVENKLK